MVATSGDPSPWAAHLGRGTALGLAARFWHLAAPARPAPYD